MCGRYSLIASPKTLADIFRLDKTNLVDFKPNYNAAPTQELPIIIHNRLGLATWGFGAITGQSTQPHPLINARSETVSSKPSFKESWQKNRRCLVPVNGIYEWQKLSNQSHTQPYFIYPKDENIMGLAGLWRKTENSIKFTILTKPAEENIAQLHHRMPVILTPDQAQGWFNATPEQAMQVTQQKSKCTLAHHPVSTAVNTIRNNAAKLMQPAEKIPEQSQLL